MAAACGAGSLGGRVSAVEGGLNALAGDVNNLRRESRQGVAAAMALTTAPLPSEPGKTSWTSNLASYRGESAFGASVAYRLKSAMPLALTCGVSFSGRKSVGMPSTPQLPRHHRHSLCHQIAFHGLGAAFRAIA